MSQRDSLSKPVHDPIYVGEAGSKDGTLRSRLSHHLNKAGWGTAFRRLVFEHIFGVPAKSRKDHQYTDRLRQSQLQITDEIRRNFAFKCLATDDFEDFEVWLIHKYQDKIWNKRKYKGRVIDRDFSALHRELLDQSLVPFSELDRRVSIIPNAVGVYLVFQI